MRVFVLLLCAALSACSLVYDTGELRDRDNLDGGADAGSDASADVSVDAALDAGPDEPDADEPDADAPDADAPDAGCALAFTEVLETEVEPGWPAQITVSFPALNCNGTLVISDFAGPFSIEEEVIMGQSELTFNYTRRVPLFPGRVTSEFQIEVLDSSDIEPATFSQMLPTTVEEFNHNGGDGDLEYDFSPMMDIANTGDAVFYTDEPGLAADRSDGDVILWRLTDEPTASDFLNVSDSMDESLAPRISDDGRLIVYASRATNLYRYYNVDTRDSGVFTTPGGSTLANNGQLDVRNSGTDYYVSLLYDRGTFQFTGARSGFDGTTHTLVEIGNATGASRPVAVLATPNGVAVVTMSGRPAFATTSSLRERDTCQVDLNNTRVAMNTGGDDFAFVGRCMAGPAETLHIGDTAFPLTASGTSGLMNASNDLDWILLSNRTSELEHDEALSIARIPLEGTPTYRALNIDLDGNRGPSLVGQRLDSASLSPDGRWAVYALTDDNSGLKRMMRVLVR